MAKKPKSPVLADHKKVGKKFIPPFVAQLGKIGEIRWANDLVPELVWLGMLIDQHGHKVGIDLSRQLAVAAHGACIDKPKEWFARTSAYQKLDKDQRTAIIATLQSGGSLGSLRQALRPLVMFYPECPFVFLFDEPPPVDQSLLSGFKKVLDSVFDRWGTPGTFVQASAIYIAFCTDMLKVVKGLALANFPAIEAFPTTEESRIVAASVRATVSSFSVHFADDEYAKNWVRYFWKRGLELEPCTLGE